ncbi:hypothetical protein ACFPRL_12105 [Pseudoclavibacter helvolus]
MRNRGSTHELGRRDIGEDRARHGEGAGGQRQLARNDLHEPGRPRRIRCLVRARQRRVRLHAGAHGELRHRGLGPTRRGRIERR